MFPSIIFGCFGGAEKILNAWVIQDDPNLRDDWISQRLKMTRIRMTMVMMSHAPSSSQCFIKD